MVLYKQKHCRLPIFAGCLALLFILDSACANKKKEKTETAVETEEPEPAHLPDTSLPSVSKYITFVTDTLEKDVPGYIADLGNQYENAPGQFTFRGGPSRAAEFGGRVSGHPTKVIVDWIYRTPYDTTKTAMGQWGGGSGWTGQPLYINWPDSLARKFGFSKEEIMVGSLARHVYFIDYKTGKQSREPLDTHNPVKGTISLDPSLNGKLYVGQALPMSSIGALVYDIFEQREISFFGRDINAWRGWGAYDSSPVAVGQFMLRPGENGTLYKLDRFSDGLSIHSTLRYRDRSHSAPGMESSMAVYRNYGYIGDNQGLVLCINLDNLRPVWVHDISDDTDATPVVQEENGMPVVYVGCEVDKQGEYGYSNFTKLNGLTGEVVWCTPIPCHKHEHGGKMREGGMFSTAYPGTGDCDSLIFSNFCFTDKAPSAGEMVAFDKYSGKIVYRVPFSIYAWSSPVGFLNENEELYIVTGDIFGNIYLIKGKTGEVIFKEHIGDNFESSPVVIGNCFVVGSRGTNIFKMHLE